MISELVQGGDLEGIEGGSPTVTPRHAHSLGYRLGGHLPLVGQLVLEALHLLLPLRQVPLVHGTWAWRGLGAVAVGAERQGVRAVSPAAPHPIPVLPELLGTFPIPPIADLWLREILGGFAYLGGTAGHGGECPVPLSCTHPEPVGTCKACPESQAGFDCNLAVGVCK